MHMCPHSMKIVAVKGPKVKCWMCQSRPAQPVAHEQHVPAIQCYVAYRDI